MQELTPEPVESQLIVHKLTARPFHAAELKKSEIADEMPTYLAGTIPVSELPGSINGSIYCFWIGNDVPGTVRLKRKIEAFIADHDVVGVRYVRDLPDRVHPSIAQAYLQTRPVRARSTPDPLALTVEGLRKIYLEHFPDHGSMVDEFVRRGLADHPDFIRLMESAIAPPFDLAARRKAGLIGARLLESARRSAMSPAHSVIAGHRCGVQSCNSKEANVYAELKGKISYVRLDLENKIAIKPLPTNPAYDFVTEHFDAFNTLCAKTAKA